MSSDCGFSAQAFPRLIDPRWSNFVYMLSERRIWGRFDASRDSFSDSSSSSSSEGQTDAKGMTSADGMDGCVDVQFMLDPVPRRAQLRQFNDKPHANLHRFLTNRT